jgi:hypothetical protein
MIVILKGLGTNMNWLVVNHLPQSNSDSKDMTTEALKYSLLGAVTSQHPVKTQKTVCVLQYSDF